MQIEEQSKGSLKVFEYDKCTKLLNKSLYAKLLQLRYLYINLGKCCFLKFKHSSILAFFFP